MWSRPLSPWLPGGSSRCYGTWFSVFDWFPFSSRRSLCLAWSLWRPKMAAPGSGLFSGRGLDISLAALQHYDPYIQGIVDVASQVALYTFSQTTNEWEKTDVEGTLFVYTRSASPKHGFTILNRLSMENRTEPITKDLDFQLQDPFLLYRNARFSIFGIWFYDKDECQRIGELMKNLTQQEQLKAQQGAANGSSPTSLGTAEGKEVDILRMLCKAKDEYTKCKPYSEPKVISSSSAIYSNPNLIKPIAVKANESQSTSQPAKVGESDKHHLSLTALFGKPNKSQEEPPVGRPSVVRSLSYEEPVKAADTCEKQLCPAIQKLMVAGGVLHPVSEIPETRPCHNGNCQKNKDVFNELFKPVAFNPTISNQDRGGNILYRLQSPQTTGLNTDLMSSSTAHCYGGEVTCSPGNVLGQTSLNYHDCPVLNQRTPASVSSSLPIMSHLTMASSAISSQELISKLHLVRQEQHFHSSPKPALAAKFPVVSQTNVSWVENTCKGEKPNLLFQPVSPQRIPATIPPTVLMSPMVFAQSSLQKRSSETVKIPLLTKEPSTSSSSLLYSAPLPDKSASANGSSVANSTLSRSQLQEALLHLIQNDDGFLNTIYETYLSVMRRGGTCVRKI
ncbi:hypothetical protein GDO86_005120 [Hymenochirus boettgeri]|uniref:5'-(N(7)-methylguanosine 5'-triphospho)-[mRNA] hydrolase n=1 Tax=Hymenochirus boettgeri TaxID=247094 RepID=A0A8T2J0T1_9PIPI|nr:hypothetical protein GDO86_005120 [Hymenochirus boettgeri]